MASAIPNFKLKKSFVWKYGIGKLHKKKGAFESDLPAEGGEVRPAFTLQPNLALNPQWSALLGDGSDPLLPEKRRRSFSEHLSSTLSCSTETPPQPAVLGAGDGEHLPPAVSQYIRATAQMQGYDVVLRDAVLPPAADADLQLLPIYETLNRRRHNSWTSLATVTLDDDDRWTVYENDTTDDELDVTTSARDRRRLPQPLYVNQSQVGCHDSDTDVESPIYENLDVEREDETVIADETSLQKSGAASDEVDQQLMNLRITVASSDHGYESNNSPSGSDSEISSKRHRATNQEHLNDGEETASPVAHMLSSILTPEVLLEVKAKLNKISLIDDCQSSKDFCKSSSSNDKTDTGDCRTLTLRATTNGNSTSCRKNIQRSNKILSNNFERYRLKSRGNLHMPCEVQCKDDTGNLSSKCSLAENKNNKSNRQNVNSTGAPETSHTGIICTSIVDLKKVPMGEDNDDKHVERSTFDRLELSRENQCVVEERKSLIHCPTTGNETRLGESSLGRDNANITAHTTPNKTSSSNMEVSIVVPTTPCSHDDDAASSGAHQPDVDASVTAVIRQCASSVTSTVSSVLHTAPSSHVVVLSHAPASDKTPADRRRLQDNSMKERISEEVDGVVKFTRVHLEYNVDIAAVACQEGSSSVQTPLSAGSCCATGENCEAASRTTLVIASKDSARNQEVSPNGSSNIKQEDTSTPHDVCNNAPEMADNIVQPLPTRQTSSEIALKKHNVPSTPASGSGSQSEVCFKSCLSVERSTDPETDCSEAGSSHNIRQKPEQVFNVTVTELNKAETISSHTADAACESCPVFDTHHHGDDAEDCTVVSSDSSIDECLLRPDVHFDSSDKHGAVTQLHSEPSSSSEATAGDSASRGRETSNKIVGRSSSKMSLSFTASLVPPPGFQDDPDAVSSYTDEVQADDPAPIPVEGVEFEEFDMDTQPRRPVVPTERSYMFGGLETHRDHSAHALTAPMSELSVGDMSEDEESPPDSSARVSRLSWTSESSLAQDRAATEPPRSAAAQFPGAVSGSTESRIAREIRELKQRERELQRLRDKTGVSVDDYLSGYGSEEKESVNGETDSGNGGHLSPDSLPSLAETGRSRSQESVSSGHSSAGAGGGGRGANDKLLYRWTSIEQRGSPSNVTMSPSSSGLSGAETPIQRDIRLASEREDERRREREMLTATSALALTSSRSAVLPSSRQIICQPEISTTSRPKIASPSTGSSSSTSGGGALNNCARASSSTALPRVSSLPTAVDPQRGIMRRFIASRGRLRPPALINRSPGQRPVTQVTGQTPGGHVTRQKPAIGSCAPQLHSVARKQQARLSLPRQNTCLIEEQPVKETLTASMSIEDRIKQELVTMQRREEELRRHQLSVFALSQPDLLAAVEQQQEEQSMTSHDECQLMMTSHSPAGSLASDSDVTSGGGQLYRTQSNPNLLNALMQGGMLGGGRRRRSELIDQWECRIQNTDP